jgi:hypothetical protein
VSELCTRDFADGGMITIATLNDPPTADAMSPEDAEQRKREAS